MAHVEDRWTVRDPDTGRRIHGARWGKGKRWMAVWVESDGARRKKSFDTKDSAQAQIEHAAVDMRAGTYVSPTRGQVAFTTVANAWYDEQIHLHDATAELIRRRLDRTILPSLGTRPVMSIDRAVVQKAVGEWSDELAPSTVAVAYSYLVAIFRHAIADRRIVTSPCVKINLPAVSKERIEPLKVEAVQALTNQAPDRYQALFILAAATGMRPSELTGLTWDRIAPAGNGARITVDRQLSRKSTSTRAVFGPLKTEWSRRSIGIGPETLKALGKRGTGLVFTKANGGPVLSYHLSSIWEVAEKGLDLPARTGFHALRHFHASLLIAAGSSPVAVAHRLGHKDARETLRTYAHLWVDDDDRMRDATDGLIRPPAPAQPQAA